MSVTSIYQRELKARGFTSDPAQLRAVEALELCADEWAGYKKKRANRRVFVWRGRAGQKFFDGLFFQRGEY